MKILIIEALILMNWQDREASNNPKAQILQEHFVLVMPDNREYTERIKTDNSHVATVGNIGLQTTLSRK